MVTTSEVSACHCIEETAREGEAPVWSLTDSNRTGLEGEVEADKCLIPNLVSP